MQERFNSIQALRALAALMVLMLHSKIMFSADERNDLLTLPGFTDFGYYGVQLFFVISGFIIAHVVNRQSFDWRTFAVKRCVRIYPLWWVVMSLGLGLYFWRSWWRADFESLGWLGVVKSFALWPQKPWPFINPGWSLEYELIFYAIVAAVLPWIRLWGVVTVLITLALTASAFRPEYGFHLVDSSYLFFAAGIIAYLLRSRSWCEAAPLAIVCLSLAYARFYEVVPMALSEAMLALAIGLASLLVTVVSLERNGWKVPKVFVRIGDISYSLYLWHWILIPSVATLRSKVFSGEGSPELWRWVFVCLSLMVAYASFRWIERPSISLGERLSQRIGKRWAKDRRLSKA